MLISAILCLVHSPDSAAQSVQNEHQNLDVIAFAPYSSWIAQVKSQLQNTKVDLAQQINSYQYSNLDKSIQFVSERVNFDTHFKASVNSNPGSELQLSMLLDTASVQMLNFNLTALIQKDLGFGTATLKLDMHCDAITLDLKNTNPASASLKVEAGKFALSQLSWDLRNTEIKTQLSRCKEVAGFDQLLKDQIQQQIEQSLVVQTLQQIINEKINPIVNQKIASELDQYIQKFKVGVKSNHQIDAQNNLWVYSGDNLDQVFTKDELQKIQTSTTPALLVKRKSLEVFAKESLNDILKRNTLSSNSFDKIKRLTCSRFVQTFIWPSLKSLSKCFEMKIQTQIKDLSITDLKSLSLNFTLGAWASGEGHQVAYFESGLSAQLMSASVQMNSFKGQSDPEFINWSRRSKRISTGIIQPALQSLLADTVLKFKENSVFKLFQKNATLKQISADTLMVGLNI